MFGNIVVKTVLLLLSLAHGETALHLEQAHAAVAAPGYAKWGRLAMEEAAKAYSGADIVDYKYEGKSRRSDGHYEESFLLLLNRNQKEFNVRVVITVDSSSERELSLKIIEL
ncbi:DUF3889 domain-containing protein [Paenibacillus sp. HB172176]|uniref:DUF3889 domain-containing protein n=1 Tax=Paenibacillus sp. HB172176 TaxID=2493690 RepID=UPI001438F8A9|nr:DUF3889 domain-containing protein [Paenibacillus sp. HB172176]